MTQERSARQSPLCPYLLQHREGGVPRHDGRLLPLAFARCPLEGFLFERNLDRRDVPELDPGDARGQL
jgi:hypothetical protein